MDGHVKMKFSFMRWRKIILFEIYMHFTQTCALEKFQINIFRTGFLI